ncbi:MAG: prepilin-type N-terminal cleavage/methylation domain-containing protein [Candidatus Obscuribacterales bacterium]|nr:prepilin-type N-terminal cleavage/methylation domain-containing protein [Candidatus Obscuribacterales bacterium]
MSTFLALNNARQRTSGLSLVEMLVSVMIIGIISAGTAELLFMNSQGSWKLFNKVDSLNAARLAIDRIAGDVRMGRNIGDITREPGDNPEISVGYFPATPSNPIYGAGQAPAGGWPGSPWPSHPYTISNTCLIIQVPIFDSNGFPQKIGTLDNTDTYVYQVLPDSTDPGTFMLQVASFPGNNSTRPVLNPPRTLLRGIIGPMDNATETPKTFQFLTSAGIPQDTVLADQMSNYTGVIVNFELRRHESVQARNRSTIGIKSEIFLRNNTLTTI